MKYLPKLALLVALAFMALCAIYLTRLASRNAEQADFWRNSYEGMVTNR